MNGTCKTDVNFSGLEGQMIAGKIIPAVLEVSVDLIKDEQVIATFMSDKEGNISYGPVPKGSY